MANQPKVHPAVIGGVILLIIIIGALWYWQSRKTTVVEFPASVPVRVPTVEKTGRNVGAAIFEKTQNPIKDKLPETNPLKRIIKNPFD